MGKVWTIPAPIKPPPPPPVNPDSWIQVNGDDVLIGRLIATPAMVRAGALNEMLEVADKVMQDSKENYCPFLNGDLRGSGVVFARDDQVILSYGGPGSGAELYAREQHENLTFNHHGVGGAKYLELPMMKWTPEIIEAAGKGVRKVIEMNNTGVTVGVDWRVVRTVPNVYPVNKVPSE